MRSTRRIWIALVAASALALVATPTLASTLVPDDEPTRSSEPAPLGEKGATDYAEKLTLPAVSTEMLEQASAIEVEFAEVKEFNTVEISADRTQIIVWWHGEPNANLKDYLDNSRVPTTLKQTPFMPGDMKAAARELVEEGSTTGVLTSYVAKEGDVIRVTLDATKSSDRELAGAELSARTGFPVEVEAGSSIEPADLARQFDTYVLGGAKVTQAGVGNSCSSGFPVQQATNKGMMFASHCGPMYSDWYVWPGSGAAYWYGNSGEVQLQVPSRDGAIMLTQWNNPAIYIGAWNSTGSYSYVNGVSSPVVGAEICYSGSYSGTQCGNIVQSASFTYNLVINGTSTVVTGAYTVNPSGNPAVGNGDSGGPGYIVATGSGTAKRYASLIISGTDGATPSCNGVPASSYRSCSNKVAGTSVSAILGATGWTISYVP